jgi:hypothetical protein
MVRHAVAAGALDGLDAAAGDRGCAAPGGRRPGATKLMHLPGWWYVSARSYLDRMTELPDTPSALAPQVRCPTFYLCGEGEPEAFYPRASSLGGPVVPARSSSCPTAIISIAGARPRCPRGSRHGSPAPSAPRGAAVRHDPRGHQIVSRNDRLRRRSSTGRAIYWISKPLPREPRDTLPSAPTRTDAGQAPTGGATNIRLPRHLHPGRTPWT